MSLTPLFVETDVLIGQQIGSGSFGKQRRNMLFSRCVADENDVSVYKCRLVGDPGAVYAVKMISIAALGGPGEGRRKKERRDQAIATIRKEIDLLASLPLTQPNIVRLIGSVMTSQKCWLIMELYDSSLAEDMSEKLDLDNNSWYNPALLLGMARQLSSGLRFLHANDVAHRDLKPENVLLVFSLSTVHELRLTDFGVSINSNETARSTAVGTLSYMAPEILLPPHRYTPKAADMFALGIILFELLERTRYHDQKHDYDFDGAPVVCDVRRLLLIDGTSGDDRKNMQRLLLNTRKCCLTAPGRPTAAELCGFIGSDTFDGMSRTKSAADNVFGPFVDSKDALSSGAHEMTICHKNLCSEFSVVTCLRAANEVRFLTGHARGAICVWSWSKAAKPVCFRLRGAGETSGHTKEVTDFRLCEARNFAVSASEDGSVCIWTWVNNALGSMAATFSRASLDTEKKGVFCCLPTYDGIFTGAHDNQILMYSWDGMIARTVETTRACSAWVRDLAIYEEFGCGASRLIASCDDGCIVIFDLSSLSLQRILNSEGSIHSDYVRCCTASSQGVAAGSDDETISLWGWDGSLIEQVHVLKGWVLAIDSSEHCIVAACRDQELVFIDWKGQLLGAASGHGDIIHGIAIHPSTRDVGSKTQFAGWIASGGQDRSVIVWSPPSGPLTQPRGETANLYVRR